jgi:hypothetical protein
LSPEKLKGALVRKRYLVVLFGVLHVEYDVRKGCGGGLKVQQGVIFELKETGGERFDGQREVLLVASLCIGFGKVFHEGWVVLLNIFKVFLLHEF